MLTSLLLAFFSTSALATAAQAAPPLAPASSLPSGNLTCGGPVYLANLKLVRAPSFEGDTVAFTSATDAQGRLQLSTSADGVKTPDYPQFLFRACISNLLPTGPVYYQEATARYYGFLIPNWHRGKCITYAGDLYSTEPASFVSEDCQTADTAALASQWWGVDVGFLAGTTAQIANFYGKNEARNGSYHLSLQQSGNADLVQAAWAEESSLSLLGYESGDLHFQLQKSIYQPFARHNG